MTEFSSNFPTTYSEAVIFVSLPTLHPKGSSTQEPLDMGACRAHPAGDPRGGVSCRTPSLSWNILVHLCPTFEWAGGPHEPGMAWCSRPSLVARRRPGTTQPPPSVIPPFPMEALSCFPPVEQRAACDLAVLGTTPSPSRAINTSQQAASSGRLSFASAKLSKRSLGPGRTCWPVVTAEAWSRHRATVAGTPLLTS